MKENSREWLSCFVEFHASCEKYVDISFDLTFADTMASNVSTRGVFTWILELHVHRFYSYISSACDEFGISDMTSMVQGVHVCS